MKREPVIECVEERIRIGNYPNVSRNPEAKRTGLYKTIKVWRVVA